MPKPNGWHDPRTDELLKSVRLSTDQINEYLGITPEPIDESPAVVAPMIDESPMADPPDLNSMTKRELEELGREHGIELDRRHNKDTLIEQLSEVI